MSRIVEIPNLDNLLRRYQAGESELKLSREFGIGRGVIRRRLLNAGIIPRNSSQAGFIRMSKLSSTEREAITAKAHEAVKGRRVPMSERERIAKTREIKGLGISTIERIMVDMLRTKGIINIVHQKAIGAYNVDIAIEKSRIAVEIYGGSWHNSKHHRLLHHKRVPYILNKGWTLVIIWVNAKHHPLTIEAANYIVSLSQSLRLNKSHRGQYRVIRGNGEPVSILSSEFNCIPVVESPTSRDSKGRFYSNIR